MPGEAEQAERNLSSWWYAGNIGNGVGRADWSSRLLHNSGDPHFSWIFGGVMVLTYPHDICGQRTWDAAEALTLYLRSVGIGNPVHWPMPSNSSFGREFVRFGFPKEGIFVTVGERQPESDVADFTGE